jgi:hypothetical protein
MPYMMSPSCEMLTIADQSGTFYTHYHQPPVDESAKFRIRGPLIEYLNDKQKANFLRNHLVYWVDSAPEPAAPSLPAVPAPAPSPRYRMTGRTDALWVTDEVGKQHMHIFDSAIAGATHGAKGAVIEWISPQQAASYLLSGWIVRIGSASVEPEPVPAPAEVAPGMEWTRQVQDADGRSLSAILGARASETQPELAPVAPVAGGLVEECLADLARLDVALDSGAPTCRKALRNNGISYGNEVIALAVRRRKVLATLSAGAAT